MSQARLQAWTTDAFFAWQAGQDERYELVDGFPLKMMTGATRRHDTIVVNLIGELRSRLRGSPCQPFTADGAVETRPGQIRRPDAGVDCGPTDPRAFAASRPTAVFEVLSPSTRDFDAFRKVGEYQALPALRHVVLLDTLQPFARHWRRPDEGAWIEETVEGLKRMLPLPGIGIDLPMWEIYEGVAFTD